MCADLSHEGHQRRLLVGLDRDVALIRANLLQERDNPPGRELLLITSLGKGHRTHGHLRTTIAGNHNRQLEILIPPHLESNSPSESQHPASRCPSARTLRPFRGRSADTNS